MNINDQKWVFWNNNKILTIEYYAKKNKKILIGMSRTCRKKNLVDRTIFEWVTVLLKYVKKISFPWLTLKILTFEYYKNNKNCSGVNQITAQIQYKKDDDEKIVGFLIFGGMFMIHSFIHSFILYSLS